MCTGFEIAALALAAGGTAASAMAASAPSPPPPANPATPAPNTKAAGSTVKLGSDTADDADASAAEYNGFAEKRVTGKTLGGLGRGGLGL